jgi:dihydroxy-acid dehydratase
LVVGHIAPEAALGGPIGLIQEGDIIEINAVEYRLNLEVSEEELARRLELWQAPAPRYKRGVLAKYAKLVSSASEGAITG